MKPIIVTDKMIVTGRYNVLNDFYDWKIVMDDDTCILTTNDPRTDCCTLGDDDGFVCSSFAECMAHLEQQVRARQEVA